MGSRIFSVVSWTPVAVADGVAFTNDGHMSIQGGHSTQVTHLLELYCGGLAAVASPTILQLARHSTVAAATLSALAGGAADAAGHPGNVQIANPPVPFTSSTSTKPQASSTLKLAVMSFNPWGGALKRSWDKGKKVMLGNTASFGEIGLNAFTGGTPGLMSTDMEYETE